MRGDDEERGDEGRARLRAVVDALRTDFGDDPELVRQFVAEYMASQRQDAHNHFEARQEYAKGIVGQQRLAMDGIREYGLQTLKWSFILNAGAIAIVVAYVGTATTGTPPTASLSTFSPLLKGLWPFAVGCILVLIATAAGFFNFSYLEHALPSLEALHQFLQPTASDWPRPRSRRLNESSKDFHARISKRLNASRTVAIFCATLSGLSFLLGVFLLLRTVLG